MRFQGQPDGRYLIRILCNRGIIGPYPDGVPIGLRKTDGTLVVRPAPETVLADDDEILIVADDDSTIDFRPTALVTPREQEIPDVQVEHFQERLMILGWSPKAPIIVSEYADYVLEGSVVDIVIDGPSEQRVAEIESLHRELEGEREHNKLITEQLVIKDEQIKAANKIALESNVREKEYSGLLKELAGRLPRLEADSGKTGEGRGRTIKAEVEEAPAEATPVDAEVEIVEQQPTKVRAGKTDMRRKATKRKQPAPTSP